MAMGQSGNRPTAEQKRSELIICDSIYVYQKSNRIILFFRNIVQPQDAKVNVFTRARK